MNNEKKKIYQDALGLLINALQVCKEANEQEKTSTQIFSANVSNGTGIHIYGELFRELFKNSEYDVQRRKRIVPDDPYEELFVKIGDVEVMTLIKKDEEL